MRARAIRLEHGGAFKVVRICAGRAKAATAGPSMQLFGDGKIQGKGVVAIPPLGRPPLPSSTVRDRLASFQCALVL